MSSILRACAHGFVTGASAAGWVLGAVLGAGAVGWLCENLSTTRGKRGPTIDGRAV